MNTLLPVFELVDSKADEKQTVRNFMDKMANIAKAAQDSETAVQSVVAQTYSAVGFGPMFSALAKAA